MKKNSRDKIIAHIQKALGRSELTETEIKACQNELMEKRAQIKNSDFSSGHNGIEQFIQNARIAGANVDCISSIATVPKIITNIVKQYALPNELVCSAKILALPMDWQDLQLITSDECAVSFTTAFLGVSETGTIIYLADQENKTTYCFLPIVHIILLNRNDIVENYDAAWERIHLQETLPACIHFITGPSRTGDIEQTIQVGMHGPKQLHILLMDKDEMS